MTREMLQDGDTAVLADLLQDTEPTVPRDAPTPCAARCAAFHARRQDRSRRRMSSSPPATARTISSALRFNQVRLVRHLWHAQGHARHFCRKRSGRVVCCEARLCGVRGSSMQQEGELPSHARCRQAGSPTPPAVPPRNLRLREPALVVRISQTAAQFELLLDEAELETVE